MGQKSKPPSPFPPPPLHTHSIAHTSNVVHVIFILCMWSCGVAKIHHISWCALYRVLRETVVGGKRCPTPSAPPSFLCPVHPHPHPLPLPHPHPPHNYCASSNLFCRCEGFLFPQVGEDGVACLFRGRWLLSTRYIAQIKDTLGPAILFTVAS